MFPSGVTILADAAAVGSPSHVRKSRILVRGLLQRPVFSRVRMRSSRNPVCRLNCLAWKPESSERVCSFSYLLPKFF